MTHAFQHPGAGQPQNDASGAHSHAPALPQLRLPTFRMRGSDPAPTMQPQQHTAQRTTPYAHVPNQAYAQPAVAQQQHHAPAAVHTNVYMHPQAGLPIARAGGLVPAQPRLIAQQPVAPAHSAVHLQQQVVAHAHAPANAQHWQHQPGQQQFAPHPPAHVAARQQVRPPAPAPRASTATATYVAFEQQQSRFTPLHLAGLVTLVVIAFIIAKGAPGASFDATTPAKLPGVATSPSGPQDLPLKRNAKATGIPSPAASASIALQRGGRAPRRNTAIPMNGMPSPAAAATLGPATLPLRRASDGMSLPRATGERDSHAADTHYGTTLPLAREDLVETPAVTPGQAGDQARIYANKDLVGDDSYLPTPQTPNSPS
jgi:hypothetical protein